MKDQEMLSKPSAGRVLDMPLHLIFGVEVNGAQELRPRKLAILYLRPLG